MIRASLLSARVQWLVADRARRRHWRRDAEERVAVVEQPIAPPRGIVESGGGAARPRLLDLRAAPSLMEQRFARRPE